jgi:phage gpG-like protein
MPDAGVSGDVTVSGTKEFAAGARTVTDHIQALALRNARYVATRRANYARSLVPQVTGRLAGSLTTTPTEEGSNLVMGDAGTPYAGWIEFGGTRGRPYMPEGRYFYPVALEYAAQLEMSKRGESDTKNTIAGFTWQTPH